MTAPVLDQSLEAKIITYLASDDDAKIKLEAFLQTGKLLYSTDEVMQMTGWSRAYITRLCRRGKLPHIPSNPNKFLLTPLKRALEDMLEGGGYGGKTTKRRKDAGKC